MSERYLELDRLPGRLYAPGTPVLIAAGVLLEDRQKNRRLAQLKFESISPKTIAALQVSVRCMDAQGGVLGAVEKDYTDLAVIQGVNFGQKTALVLPAETVRMEAAVSCVKFEDGTVWKGREGLAWRSLGAPAAPAAPAAKPTPAAPAVSAAPVVQAVAPAEKTESASFVQHAPAKKAGGKKWVLGAVIAVAVVAALVLLAPMLGGGSGGGLGGNSGGSSGGGISLPALGGGGKVIVPEGSDTVKLVLQEDGEGRCRVTEDAVRELFPEMTALYFSGVPNMGEDLDEYIKDSYYMARLVGSRGEDTDKDSYGSFTPGNDSDSPRCLLVFDGPTSLCGYVVAQPKSEGGGKWSLTMTRDHYDFSGLYADELRNFQNRSEYDYIDPEDALSCGAESFLYAYNMSNTAGKYNDAQLYHLWNREQSAYLDKHLRSMDRWEDSVPSGTQQNPVWRFYLLFDGNNEVIGYTVRCNDGRFTFDPEKMGPAFSVSTPSAGETVTVQAYAVENENYCVITLEELQKVIPNAVSLDMFSCAAQRNDLDDYLLLSDKMSHWVASGDASRHRNQQSGFSANNSSMMCLLVFSDDTTLCGYACFWPREENGTVSMEVTLCDYDLKPLYDRASREYASADIFNSLKRMDPAEVEGSGVAYVGWIEQISSNHNYGWDLMGYGLWSAVEAPYGLGNNCADLEWALTEWFPDVEEDRIGCYLLMDENYEAIGYTIIGD